MALTLGTNVGFVRAAPTADPGGTDVVIDGASVVCKDISPADASKITEIGWYRGSGTNSANFEVALYSEASGVADARLFVNATNSSTTQGWIRVTVDWPISPDTAYWLAVQMDAHTGSSYIDSATSGGLGIDRMTSQTTLNDPYGGGAVTDADGMYAIYALLADRQIALATAAVSAAGQALTVVEGEVSPDMATAAISAAGQAITIDPGSPLTTVVLSTAQITAQGQAISIDRQGAVILAASDNIPAGGATATTAQLTPPSGKTTGDFQAGYISDDTNPLGSLNLASDKYTELEWSIKLSDAAEVGETYEFRVTINGTVLDGYTVTPDITAGVGPVTVQLSTAQITAQADAIDVVPGVISIALDAAEINGGGVVLAVDQGTAPTTIVLGTASVTAAGQTSAVVEGAVAVILDVAEIAAQGQALEVVEGVVIIAIATGSITAQGQAVTISAPAPGSVNVTLDTASVTAQGQVTEVVEGAVSIALATGAMAASGEAITVSAPTPGAINIGLDTANISATGQALEVIEGAVSIAIATGQVSLAGQALVVDAPIPSQTISLDTGLVAADGQAMIVVEGAVSIALATAAITATGQTISLLVIGLITNYITFYAPSRRFDLIAPEREFDIGAPSRSFILLAGERE